MKRDFTQPLLHINGQPLVIGNDPATLGLVAVTAVMAPKIVNGEAQPANGLEALKALELSIRIYGAIEPVEVTAEEVVYLKERIEAYWTLPIVVGSAWKMLEA